MRYIVQLNDINLIGELIENEVTAITVGINQLSNGAIINASIEDIEDICQKAGSNIAVYVLLNQLYDQVKIEELELTLEKLSNTSVKGIFFQDFGLLQIVQERQYSFDLVYAPDTLNNSFGSLNALKKLGVDKFLLSGQLHLDEIVDIVDNVNASCIVPIHGVLPIAYSKRMLLENYFNLIKVGQKTDYNEKLKIKVNNKDEYSYIYEDYYGTHIYTTNQLCTLGIEMPGAYGYIETMYMDNSMIIDTIKAYRNSESFESFASKHNGINFDTGFLNEGTVYKLEDVRKRDENERS